MVKDKVTLNAEHYRKGIIRALGAEDTMGHHAAQLYEDGIRGYLANPVVPVSRRFEVFMKHIAKKHPEHAWEVVRLSIAIELQLQSIVKDRDRLLEIAKECGIKLKRGIII